MCEHDSRLLEEDPISRLHYTLRYRLDGVDAFLLWYTGERDGLVLTAEGRLVSSRTEDALLAEAHGLSLEVERGDASGVFDLDAVAAWLIDPRADAVEGPAFLNAWNLFADVARSAAQPGKEFSLLDRRAGALYEKLFWSDNLPAVTPEGERFVPCWSPGEARQLTQLLREGFVLFVRLVDAR